MSKPNNRDVILDAAEQVVASQGAANLTLDSVAEAANVSKGGLLYHFPSKESLLQGMIARMIERFHARRTAALAASPQGPGRELHSMLAAQCHRDPAMYRLGCALLAASANDPRLMAPFRDRFHEDLRTVFGGLEDFPSAAILFLASEGMAKLDLLGLNPFTPEEREAIRAEILRRVAELR